MKVTNITEAPKPFLWATEKSSWPPNPSRLYVTQLFAPPMQRRLKLDHYDEIENDVIDYYYRILGSSVHSIIEQAAKDRVGVQTEVRVAMPKAWFGIEITGRIDWIDYIDSILADIKTASADIAGRGVKDDWVSQGNIYRYMLYRIHGLKMDNLLQPPGRYSTNKSLVLLLVFIILVANFLVGIGIRSPSTIVVAATALAAPFLFTA